MVGTIPAGGSMSISSDGSVISSGMHGWEPIS